MDAVKLPAIFLIVVGSLGVLFALWGIIQYLTGQNEAEMAKALSDPNVPPAMKSFMQSFAKGGILLPIWWLLVSGFVIFGAVNMMKLRSFGLSMAAAIVAMIPCIGGYPCCCILGLPIGIWALVVLNKPEVKSAFS